MRFSCTSSISFSMGLLSSRVCVCGAGGSYFSFSRRRKTREPYHLTQSGKGNIVQFAQGRSPLRRHFEHVFLLWLGHIHSSVLHIDRYIFSTLVIKKRILLPFFLWMLVFLLLQSTA